MWGACREATDRERFRIAGITSSRSQENHGLGLPFWSDPGEKYQPFCRPWFNYSFSTDFASKHFKKPVIKYFKKGDWEEVEEKKIRVLEPAKSFFFFFLQLKISEENILSWQTEQL